MNFKLLAKQTGKLVLFYIMELRGLYWRIMPGKSFSAKILPGMGLKMFKKGDIAEIVYKNEVLVKHKKSFEYSTLETFSKKIIEGDIIIDVGANAGLYSVFFSKLAGHTGRVLSFEPDKETSQLLKMNLELNGCSNVSVFNSALSDKDGYVQMQSYTPETLKLKDGDAFKYIRQVTDANANSGSMPNVVNAFKMDDLKEINSLPKIDYIKVDVEGAELLVLKGGIETIKKYKPVIIFELSGKWAQRFSYRPFEVLLMLHNLGYQLEEYDFEQWLAEPIK